MARSGPITGDLVPLPVLARRINEAHENCLKDLRHGLQYGIAAGQDLLKVKTQVGHGNFEGWIEKHCSFGRSAAYEYIAACEKAAIEGGAVHDVGPDTPVEVLRYFLRKAAVAEESDPKPPRFEAWKQINSRIIEWAKANSAEFAVRWLKQLAEEIELNVRQ